MNTAVQIVSTELQHAESHLRKAMDTAQGLEDRMHHDLAQLVFALGCQLDAWNKAHAHELNPASR